MTSQSTISLTLALFGAACTLMGCTGGNEPVMKEISAGDSNLANDRNSDALLCYRQEAQNRPEAAMRVGQLLLFGKSSAEPGQSVVPDPKEGIRWTFWAATNRSAKACEHLAIAFEHLKECS